MDTSTNANKFTNHLMILMNIITITVSVDVLAPKGPSTSKEPVLATQIYSRKKNISLSMISNNILQIRYHLSKPVVVSGEMYWHFHGYLRIYDDCSPANCPLPRSDEPIPLDQWQLNYTDCFPRHMLCNIFNNKPWEAKRMKWLSRG